MMMSLPEKSRRRVRMRPQTRSGALAEPAPDACAVPALATGLEPALLQGRAERLLAERVLDGVGLDPLDVLGPDRRGRLPAELVALELLLQELARDVGVLAVGLSRGEDGRWRLQPVLQPVAVSRDGPVEDATRLCCQDV